MSVFQVDLVVATHELAARWLSENPTNNPRKKRASNHARNSLQILPFWMGSPTSVVRSGAVQVFRGGLNLREQASDIDGAIASMSSECLHGQSDQYPMDDKSCEFGSPRSIHECTNPVSVLFS